jgi:hypothetical protein
MTSIIGDCRHGPLAMAPLASKHDSMHDTHRNPKRGIANAGAQLSCVRPRSRPGQRPSGGARNLRLNAALADGAVARVCCSRHHSRVLPLLLSPLWSSLG